MNLMNLWILTGGLLAVTVATFLWARTSSRRGRGAGRAAPAPAKRARAASPSGDFGAAPGGLAEAASPPPAIEAPAASSADGGNALAWATFAVSAFGTLSSFVFSLLTYLRQSS